MRRFVPVLIASVALWGCSTAQIQTAAQAVTTACTEAEGVLTTVQGQVNGGAANSAAEVGTYLNAVCGTATAIATAAQDPTTLQWIGIIEGELNALIGTPASSSPAAMHK